MTSAARARISIASPADVAIVVPHILGFMPTESAVVVGIGGLRKRLGMAIRVDLPEVETWAPQMVGRLLDDDADEFVLAIFSDLRPGISLPGRPRQDLPHTDLIARFRDLGLPMMDAVLVSGDRAWSYLCAEDCCPPSGHLIADGPESDRIRATFVGVGMAVVDSRESLIALVDPPVGPAADQAAAQLESAIDWVLTLQARERVAELHGALDEGLRACADPRGVLTPGECARILVLLADIRCRDEALCRMVSDIFPGDPDAADDADRFDVWRSLLLQLMRSSVSIWDAPVSTLFAVAAYHSGDGVLACAAIERALRCRPDYGLANLLADALDAQLHPEVVMRALVVGTASTPGGWETDDDPLPWEQD